MDDLVESQRNRFRSSGTPSWLRVSVGCGTMTAMGFDDLADAMRQFDDAVQQRDRSALDEVLDADYALVLVHPAAVFMPRGRWLDVLADYVMHDYAIEEQYVDIDGDVAAVLTRVRMQAVVLGVDRSGVFVVSDTWRRRGDGWRVWRRHSSPLAAGEMPTA